MDGPVSAAVTSLRRKQDLYELARPARDLLAAGPTPDFAAQDERLWLLALDLLIAEGELDAASTALGPLMRHFPESASLANLAMVFGRLPPPTGDGRFDAFRDDLGADVQVVPRVGATTVMLGFCGNGGKMNLPLSLMHRWLGHADVHVIYLRDMVSKLFMRGVGSLGPDYPASLAALRELAAGLGAERIVCQGVSAGGFAALRFGLDLGATSVLVFGAQSHPFLSPDRKVKRLVERFGITEALDLRPLYEAAPSPPRVRFVFSSDHERDAEQANHMAGANGVTLEPVATGGDHGVMLPVLECGRFDQLLRELVTGEPAPPSALA